MNRIWIILISVVLIIAVSGVLFLNYIKQNKPGFALSGNVYEFNKLNGFSEIDSRYLDNESFAINTGLNDFDQLNSHIVKSTTKTFVVNPNDGSFDINISLNDASETAVATRTDNTPRVNLVNKDFLFYLFKDITTWNKIISNKKYTVTSDTLSWDISIDPDSIKDLMEDTLKFYTVHYLELQGTKTFDQSKVTVTGFTSPNVIITIDKASNLITKIEFIINEDCFVNFNVGLKDIDPGQSSSEKLSVKYGKGYQLGYQIKSIKFSTDYQRFQNLGFIDAFGLKYVSF